MPTPKSSKPRHGYRRLAIPKPGGIGKIWTDPATGLQYPSLGLMERAIRANNRQKITQFEHHVAAGTLGQDPWQKLPGEPDAQYARFRAYILMEKRSLARVASKVGVAEKTLKPVSVKWHWVLRAACWEREMEREEERAFQESRRISNRRQARLGQRLQDAAGRGLDALMTGAIEMTPSDVSRLADTGVKIQRLAMDKSTSNEHTVTQFIYEGRKPRWADSDEDVAPQVQDDPGPLTRHVLEATSPEGVPEP